LAEWIFRRIGLLMRAGEFVCRTGGRYARHPCADPENNGVVRFRAAVALSIELYFVAMIQSAPEIITDIMRVLLAEDEKKVAQHIRAALREQGFTVDMFHRGDEALEAALATPYDALVLDVMMPGRDGLSILRVLREKCVPTPVLLVTARGEVSERVEGLMLGADDYLSKPFAMSELVARVIALSRRGSAQGLTMLRVEDLSMNLVNREVIRAGRKLELPLREFALLEYLLRSPGRVISKTQLIENVWEWHFDTGTNVVEVYIQRLRKKVDDGHEVKLIHTVRGIGYVLKREG
jgi:DNA-binding response OmpR family regulator